MTYSGVELVISNLTSYHSGATNTSYEDIISKTSI